MTSLPEYTTLSLSLADRVLEVRLNRPEAANAMNRAMWVELQAAFEWADAAADVRAVILSGEGRHFCSGIDLSMFAEGSGTEHEDPSRASELFFHHVRGLQANLQSLQKCRKPVLAAIHGACYGGAIDMICYADMRYCTANTKFCVKEIDVGLVADVGTLQNLPHLIPDGLVRELAYTARDLFAEEAREAGLVNRVFDDREAMMVAVRDIALNIAAKTPLVVRGTKQVLNYTRDHSVEDGLEYVALWNSSMMSKLDIQEAMSATLEKRVANFLD